MKNIIFYNLRFISFAIFCLFLLLGCERNLSDDAVVSNYSQTANVFIDAPIEMGSNFYFPYSGSKPTAWSIDNSVSYQGTASMRFDVPNATDLEGNYAGAIFRAEGAGRNLTNYDALTFWAKASQGAIVSEFGFGEDFFDNKFMTTITNVGVGTAWTKYIIPIPDASKLIQERGMFRYAAGTQGTNSLGYTIWIDELKFEKLGTISAGKASILAGANVTQNTFVGVKSTIDNIKVTFNMPNGINQSVNISPSYLQFVSSNTAVATVDSKGIVTSVSQGVANITATLAGTAATGRLTINCQGTFNPAPIPTRNQSNVISLFSDVYTNIAVDFFNGYWGGSTTQTNLLNINNNNYQSYTTLNYVGIQTNTQTVNASTMSFLHLDLFPTSVATTSFIIKVRDRGANGIINSDNNGNANVDDKEIIYTIPSNQLPISTWKSIDIPLNGNILNQKNNLALIVFIGNNDFYLDNLYYYKP